MARVKRFPSPRFIPIVSHAPPPSRTEVLRERARKRHRGETVKLTRAERARELVSIGARDKRGRFIPKKKRMNPREVALEFGVKDGVEYARALDWNPEDWASEVADDFDIAQHDLYNAYYGYSPDGAGVW